MTSKAGSSVAIQVENLGVRLPRGRGVGRLWSKGHWAFRDVSFKLKRGETVALIGRNGSGKSTMLRTLAGIISPDEGRLQVADGLTTTILAPGAGFDPMLTGRENLYTAALYQGHFPSVIDKHIDDIIAFSEIGNWVDEPLAIYSAGMRARLGFSLSLFLPADILMIDETLSAGDGSFRDKAREAVQDLIRSDRTVVLISHSPQMMEAMCQRGLILDRGSLVVDGSIGEVLDAYDRLMTGQFDMPEDAPAAIASDGHRNTEEELAELRRDAVVQKAAAILRDARSQREAMSHVRNKAKEAFWIKLDALLKDVQTIVDGKHVSGAGDEMMEASLAQNYQAFLDARRHLEGARSNDLQRLAEMREATERWRRIQAGHLE
ncbi:MAG: ATP-binding cassette domain-containing protein [Hyphomicrobiaceae bacterium]|nr:ATP-binding cassette domain-containing protein [Hyphomicrobiaceae bacterium]